MLYTFVYGTLRAGEINDIRLAARRNQLPEPELISHGSLPGSLYDFGAYPGMVPDADGEPVVGEVYAIDAGLVPVLDEIEAIFPGRASLFIRTTMNVNCGDTIRTCVVYSVAAEAVAALPKIASGDWVAYRKARETAGA